MVSGDLAEAPVPEEQQVASDLVVPDKEFTIQAVVAEFDSADDHVFIEVKDATIVFEFAAALDQVLDETPVGAKSLSLLPVSVNHDPIHLKHFGRHTSTSSVWPSSQIAPLPPATGGPDAFRDINDDDAAVCLALEGARAGA